MTKPIATNVKLLEYCCLRRRVVCASRNGRKSAKYSKKMWVYSALLCISSILLFIGNRVFGHFVWPSVLFSLVSCTFWGGFLCLEWFYLCYDQVSVYLLCLFLFCHSLYINTPICKRYIMIYAANTNLTLLCPPPKTIAK